MKSEAKRELALQRDAAQQELLNVRCSLQEELQELKQEKASLVGTLGKCVLIGEAAPSPVQSVCGAVVSFSA